jgi:hypothetical protein
VLRILVAWADLLVLDIMWRFNLILETVRRRQQILH